MFKLKGILKKEEIKEFTRKDGKQGRCKILYIEPEGGIYPIKVTVSDMDFRAGKEGDVVTLDVAIFPFYFEDRKRKKASVDFYIPNKK